jgi:hypothetical protein
MASIARMRRLAPLLVLLLQGAAPTPPLVARRITAATASVDLFSGSDATGGIGDWALSNGIVQAVVDDVGYQVDRYQASGVFVPIQGNQALSGGTLVDLGLVGHDDDQITSIYPLLNANSRNAVQYVPASFARHDPTLPAVIANVDTTAGIASLTVDGFALLGPNPQQLTIETEYSLRAGESFLRVRSTLRNTGTTSLPVTSFGDSILLGRGGTFPFAASPGRGFTVRPGAALAFYHTVLGRLAPGDGVADTDAMKPAGEVSYTFYGEDGVVYALGDSTVSTVGKPPLGAPLAPGATYVYERRIYVGDRNDAASSTDLVLPEISQRSHVPMGRVRGRLVSPSGDPFRASITVVETDAVPSTPQAETLLSGLTGDASPLPITQIYTDSGRAGLFEAVVPAGRNQLSIEVESRDPIAPISFQVLADQVTDVGDVTLSQTGRLAVHVTDADGGLAIPARVTLIGIDVPSPTLGVPLDLRDANGQPQLLERKYSSPYKNVLYTETGDGEVALRPGRYRAIASHGVEYDMGWADAQVTAGGRVALSLAVRRAVDTTGWLGADFHIHASPSADSSVPPADRVRSYAAEGVQVMVSADHDFVFDYGPLIRSMGLASRVASIVGCETTTVRPFAAFPSGVGHFNGWPLVPQPQSRKNGAPEDEQSEPGVLYDRLRGLGARVVQMNHPFTEGQGFLGAIGFDATKSVGVPPNDALLRPSALGTGTTNLDFDAIEIYNGLSQSQLDLARAAWFSLLDQGIVKTATANSDSHDLSPSGPGLGPGMPRTYVAYTGDADLAGFDATAFDAALAAGRAFGSSGPFVAVDATSGARHAGLGETLPASGGVAIHVRVQAPCWIPIGDVRLWANGALLADDPVSPDCVGTPRYDHVFAAAPSADTYYVVEVLEPTPRPPPTGFLQQLAALVYPQVHFEAFANPIFVDVDGNGRFDPPGLAAGQSASARGGHFLAMARTEPLSP